MNRVFYILFFVVLLSVQSKGQSSRSTPGTDATEKIIKAYPNPAISYIIFDLQANYKKGLTIYVYNGILGKKMFELQNIPERITLNLNDFNRGVYIYQLIDITGKIIESGKFQVSH